MNSLPGDFTNSNVHTRIKERPSNVDIEGTGDTKARWLEEVRSAIKNRVPSLPDENFNLGTFQAVSVILKKRNWSAPGPD